MKFGGDKSFDSYDPIGQQGFPMLPNSQVGPGYSPGSIRNTLGSGLKSSGFFQKDGQIKNMRGGFIGNKQMQQYPAQQGMGWQAPPPMNGSGQIYSQSGGGYNQGMGYSQSPEYSGGYGIGQPRQLVLQAAQEGIIGNGVATISPDNSFILIANLPLPQVFLGQGQAAVYAVYLVEERGKRGFLAGTLRPVSNGVYRLQFQSQVPLHHYSRAVVSAENPAQLGQAPNGPIILKVKEPMGVVSFLAPMKNTAGSVWGKISGLFRKKAPVVPDAAPPSPELLQSLNQAGVVPETMVSPNSPAAPESPLPQVPFPQPPTQSLPPQQMNPSLVNPQSVSQPLAQSDSPTLPPVSGN